MVAHVLLRRYSGLSGLGFGHECDNYDPRETEMESMAYSFQYSKRHSQPVSVSS